MKVLRRNSDKRLWDKKRGVEIKGKCKIECFLRSKQEQNQNENSVAENRGITRVISPNGRLRVIDKTPDGRLTLSSYCEFQTFAFMRF